MPTLQLDTELFITVKRKLYRQKLFTAVQEMGNCTFYRLLNTINWEILSMIVHSTTLTLYIKKPTERAGKCDIPKVPNLDHRGFIANIRIQDFAII